MANNTTSNPWVLDTASNTAITADKIRVQKLRWDSEGAAGGDNVIIKDSAGHVWWAATAAAAKSTIESDQFKGVAGDIRGFVLDTINSGTLYVYYE